MQNRGDRTEMPRQQDHGMTWYVLMWLPLLECEHISPSEKYVPARKNLGVVDLFAQFSFSKLSKADQITIFPININCVYCKLLFKI